MYAYVNGNPISYRTRAAKVTPSVRGGWNFNPWTTSRYWGPKARQVYVGEIVGHIFDHAKEKGENAMEESKNSCECQ